ncbi:nucleoside recognition domain-containing protein [Tepidibacillus infernus]|uniref:Nucleoside recognition protein n=1 Tax=Tepidibacillus decaturensis TaxID=1413211 RepID=A0A135L2V9_9BACI|nr:nucleoside recognition domain-containing protein [Tepidibacillus decaturensis]KXG43358.1 nucleoside recognition protein [Tepidibacillus decaturensis]
MVNWLWAMFIMIGIVTAAIQGKIEIVNHAIFEGAKTGVTISFGLISILVFWLGIMKIAEEAGLLIVISRLLRPIVRWLFPDVPKDNPALGYILSNIAANIFGLGNAATPMGIKAMQELQKINPYPDRASPTMATLLALNTSSITLIPTQVIAIRMSYGSVNPTEIVGTTILATLFSTLSAILLDRWYRKKTYKS